ncbi:MAG: VCBS repeat-containing protein [Paracoccaceae bacterium]
MGWRRFALGVATLVALAAPAFATPPNIITGADYEDPTTRYDHGILGDAIEWGSLRLSVDMCQGCETSQLRDFIIRLPENRVFEDIAPRLVPLDDAAGPAVMVVETDLKLGARLALYDESGLIAATPFIGRTHRWLAPIGAADLDGDGQIEYAYVDRPHLARTIRIWRLQNGALVNVIDLPGFTNHHIGEDNIAGGIRDCGAGPEMIVVDANWQNIIAISHSHPGYSAQILGAHKNRRSFARALNCQN